jgi:hypothetical protein
LISYKMIYYAACYFLILSRLGKFEDFPLCQDQAV